MVASLAGTRSQAVGDDVCFVQSFPDTINSLRALGMIARSLLVGLHPLIVDERMQAHKERSGYHPECPERIGCSGKLSKQTSSPTTPVLVGGRTCTIGA